MIRIGGRVEGLEGLDDEFVRETLRDAVPIVEHAARRIAERGRRNLGRSGPPSRPGEFPARVEGWLQRAFQHSRAEIHGKSVTAFVGIGAGKQGRAEVARAKAAGVDIYAEAQTLEYGGVHSGRGGGAAWRARRGPRGASRLQARPYLRPTIEQMRRATEKQIEAGLP